MEPQQESVTEPEVRALLEALDDEYKAVATYEEVIADFGPIRPFVNIIEAERRHIEALRSAYNRCNVEMPANPWPGTHRDTNRLAKDTPLASEADREHGHERTTLRRHPSHRHHRSLREPPMGLSKSTTSPPSGDAPNAATTATTTKAASRDADDVGELAPPVTDTNPLAERSPLAGMMGRRRKRVRHRRRVLRCRIRDVGLTVPRALEHRVALGWCSGAALFVAAGFVAAGCGAAAANQVADGTYLSLVPPEAQFALDVDGALPGGVAQLREDGVNRVDVDISGDQVVFRIDGVDMATRSIIDRVDITDREGSGPFKAKKQILVLGDAPLVLGALIIDKPVIWPGSFEESPVITIKPRDPDERGPSVSCNADQPCLLMSSGVNPAGSYADANNPELDQNPIDSILINDESIDLALDSGDQVTISTTDGSFTRACGLSENNMWDLPAEIGLAINDPVLVHTLCPSTPGAAIQLIIMDRSAIPILAPLTEAREGDWCTPSPDCLLFVPT